MRHRLILLLPGYLLLYAASYAGAFLLRFDFRPPADYAGLLAGSLPAAMGLKLAAGLAVGEWRRTFRYATLADVLYIAAAAGAGAVLIYGAGMVFFPAPSIPRSVIVIDAALTVLLLGLARTAARLCSEIVRRPRDEGRGVRTVIYGADRAGLGILRALQATRSQFRVVGFVEEGGRRRHSLVAGVPVLALPEVGWKRVRQKLRAGQVLIPSSVPGRSVRRIVRSSAEAGLKASVIPQVHEIVDGRYRLSARDVTISDLLRREPARLDLEGIRGYVSGRRVLVTGGAGSIGSELCRQVLALGPQSLTLLDRSELGVFGMERELRSGNNDGPPVQLALADVTDPQALARVMQRCRPELVFHAAAYKHVPLMEENPQEAIRNNVLGTRSVIEGAIAAGAERMVLISTDKAVRPASVMGATKLLAEKCMQAAAGRSGNTRLITVRFGNVLDSAGSVVPTFRRQIAAGGPLTVTHPEMKRYFMTIPEAVQLVLQAGALGGSGEVLTLEMGEPVRILDLAKDMILLSGLKHPEDIDIVFTGVRPGEKLCEQLYYDSENGSTRKVHEQIFCARRAPVDPNVLDRDLDRLAEAAEQPDPRAAAATLREITARYTAEKQPPQQTRKAA